MLSRGLFAAWWTRSSRTCAARRSALQTFAAALRCLLDLGNGFVTAGDNVALRFASGMRVNGRVTLLHGRIARVEFEQPLHEAIYEHLASSEGTRAAPVERCFTRSHRVASAARPLG